MILKLNVFPLADSCQSYIASSGGLDYCNKNGACVTDNKGNKGCICSAAFSGLTCNFNRSSCSNSSYCLNGGTCLPTTQNMAGYTCICRSGFSGSNCQSNEIKF